MPPLHGEFSVITDGVDVTHSPTDAPVQQVNAVLLDAGFTPQRGDRYDSTTYRSPCGRGTVRVDVTPRFVRCSTSGLSCASLRDSRHWMDYLSVLSSSPHSVTKLDAALDLALDGAQYFQHMCRLYPHSVSLGRKAIRTSWVASARDDGHQTGTWYAGYRSSAKATAKVYDKAHQMLERFGETIPPRARVEVTAKKGFGATLRDAAMPEALFWHIASPALIQAPEGVPMWQPNTDGGWEQVPRLIEPSQVLRRRVESSAELAKLVELAASIEGGVPLLQHLLRQRVDQLASAAAPPLTA